MTRPVSVRGALRTRRVCGVFALLLGLAGCLGPQAGGQSGTEGCNPEIELSGHRTSIQDGEDAGIEDGGDVAADLDAEPPSDGPETARGDDNAAFGASEQAHCPAP